jgi:hypothetical protein
MPNNKHFTGIDDNNDFDPSLFGAFNAVGGSTKPMTPKELPYVGSGERIVSIIIHILGVLGGLSVLGTGMYYAINPVTVSQNSQSYWGVLGVVAIALFGLLITVSFLLSGYYHFIAINREKHEAARLLNIIGYYLVFGSIYNFFAFVALRPAVTDHFFLGNSTGYISYLILGFGWAFVLAGILANVLIRKNKRLVADINSGFLILGLWPLICFYPILATDYAFGHAGMWLMIFAPVMLFIGFIFQNLGKTKPHFHTIWHIFYLGALSLVAVAFIYYGLATVGFVA